MDLKESGGDWDNELHDIFLIDLERIWEGVGSVLEGLGKDLESQN